MPSPTSTTVPTLRLSASVSNVSIADLMMLTISSERMAIGDSWCAGRARTLADARHEALAEPLEATPDAGVIEGVADANGEPADQRFVKLDVKVHASTRHLGHLLLEHRCLFFRQRPRRAGDRVNGPALLVQHVAELRRDLGKLLDPASPDQQADQIHDRLRHLTVEPRVDDVVALAEGAAQVAQDRQPFVVSQERGGEIEAGGVLVELAACELEGRLGVASRCGRVLGGHPAPDWLEPGKPSARNSSTSRRW